MCSPLSLCYNFSFGTHKRFKKISSDDKWIQVKNHCRRRERKPEKKTRDCEKCERREQMCTKHNEHVMYTNVLMSNKFPTNCTFPLLWISFLNCIRFDFDGIVKWKTRGLNQTSNKNKIITNCNLICLFLCKLQP